MIIRIAWFLLLLMAFSLPLSGQEQRTDNQSGSLSIGAYYYPWYRAAAAGETGWMSKALRGRLKPQQLPKLGVYGSQDPKVIGGHIAQSLQAGLDFWAVSWWGPGKREDVALREHILTHPDANNLRYAILYESTGRLGSMRAPKYDNLLADFRYMKETVFDHPAYLKIDGKPVVFIYLTRVYFKDRGLEPLAKLRKAFPDLYLVGDDVFGGRYHEHHARLWDAVTAYDVYGQSMKRDGATQAAVDRLHGNYQNAKKVANGVGTAFIPGIAPGYNDRAVREGHAGRARTFTDQKDSKEGDIFRSMIKDVAIPLADPKANRTIMITSFNEWYEDTQIEPTKGGGPSTAMDDSDTGTFYTEGDRYADYGDLYLDILREEMDRAAKVAATENLEKPLESILVSQDGRRFVRGPANEEFIVWGVNYDHDSVGTGRLLDEYWEDEWETVVADFAEIKELGSNCVRIHLQLGKFMDSPNQANAAALSRLAKLVKLAEETRLYLDVTGLACYHKQNIPEWYDQLGEQERWAVQAVFWEAVAEVCAGSPAIFCYDLMNEPILPGKEPAKEWLTGDLGGKFFVQRISLDLKGRSREEVAEAWVNKMVAAIRKHDQRSLITVGVIPWVFTFGGGKPLFHGPQVGKQLDFVAVHFYPEKGEIEKALKALKAYEIGKPLVIEEMFPLKCSQEELMTFVDQSAEHTDGWISFYWGQTAEELREKDKPSIAESITASWLETFQKKSPVGKQPNKKRPSTGESSDARPPGGDGSMFYRVFVVRNDQNDDGVIEKSEFRGSGERFDQMDGNKNGKLDRAEIDSLHRSRVADPLSMRQRMARGATGRPPANFPPNSGTEAGAGEGVAQKENGEPAAVTPLGTRITAKQAFARLDVDMDGKVTATEFQRSPGMEDAAKSLTVVQRIDRDGDGNLSFVEFNKLFAQRHSGIGPADNATDDAEAAKKEQ